jgi:hypothetical protein
MTPITDDSTALDDPLHKFPRTPHLQGSRLQPGDEDLDQIPLSSLLGRWVVIEEKLDGANAGISLDGAGALRLQSRGHFLAGGGRERHFAFFKQWANTHATALARLLTGGRTIYGEWLYAKHTVFYDSLPHYFLEFDVREPDGTFWSTARRRAFFAGTPITSVPVLWEGVVDRPERLPRLVNRSLYKSQRWRDSLVEAIEPGLDADRVRRETDQTDLAEGLYLKVEESGRVVERYKWVRASFLTSVVDSGSHWLSRPVIPNRLAPGVNLFGPSENP